MKSSTVADTANREGSGATGMVDVATRSDDPLAVLGTDGAVYILPDLKTLFVSIAKNGCTSIKWMLADMLGEDIAGYGARLGAYADEDHAVHTRAAWKRAFTPAQLTADERRQIRPDNGWFIFAVVRDPRERLFSAWQDKLLMQNPGFSRYRPEPWFPRMPTDAEAAIEDFARFVDWGVANMDHKLFRDNHFRPQMVALKLHAVSYSRIYDISEMATMRADLSEHARAQGWTGELTQRKTANNTPLRATAALLDNGVRENIEKMYAADFGRFGEQWDFAAIERNPEWTDDALMQVRLRAGFSRRIGDVLDIARQNERRAKKTGVRADALATQLKQANKQIQRAEQRATQAERRARRWERQVRSLGAQPARSLPQSLRVFARRAVRAARRRLAGRV